MKKYYLKFLEKEGETTVICYKNKIFYYLGINLFSLRAGTKERAREMAKENIEFQKTIKTVEIIKVSDD